MTQSITYRGTVYPWQCDHVGHMNVMWYVHKFDEATWQFFASIGLTPAFLRDNHRGMAAVQQNISYKQELMAMWWKSLPAFSKSATSSFALRIP